ncbi:MAG TPA: DUF99 family protein [Methanosarcinales archaeon]|nr:DUF99 family protein [Methanosarcinales archaeon]
MHIKPEIRILGIDDSALLSDRVMIIGTVFRGGEWIDGILRSEITKDGMDATSKIIELVTKSKHYDQIRVIMLDGVTYAGFNVVDVREVYNKTKLPVIVVMRSLPDFEKIKKALKYLNNFEERWNTILKAGKIISVVTHPQTNPIYIQFCGVSEKDAKKIVQLSSTHSHIPEPIRVAHLIATGIVLGESTGKA